MDTFRAGVQYNDFQGTVAADISDNASLTAYLKNSGKAEEGERVVGFRFGSGENHGSPVTEISLVAYLLRSEQFEETPKAVRAVEVIMPPNEVLAFFKRFDLVAVRKGVDLTNAQVDGPHYD